MAGLRTAREISPESKLGESMSHTAVGTEPYLAAHQALASMLPAAGIPWLDHSRKSARDQFGEMGFPTIRDEQWKYTNVRSITRQAFALPPADSPSIDRALVDNAIVPGMDTYRLVFADGILVPQFSHCDDLPEGVTVTGLANVLRTDSAHLEGIFGKVLREPTHGFNAMNSAFVCDGAFVEIGPGVVMDRPLELLFVSATGGEGMLALPRNLVLLRAGSQATLHERYISASPARCLTNAVSEVLIEEDAKLHLGRLQEESERSFHIGGLFAEVGRNACLTTNVVTLGGALVRNDLAVNLNEEGAEVRLHGLYVAHGRQHVDNHTQVFHNHPGTTSNECYKGILNGHARAVFRGHILVQPDAQKTDAVQNNHNLLLSPNAEVDTMPQLEIYADDVKCAHGASVGQLEEDAIFYLRSRGVGEMEAKQMLTRGFAAEVLEELEPPPLREYLQDRIDRLMELAK